MKKPDLSKFAIVTKKDWVIFWTFAALVAYSLAGFFQGRIDTQLRKIGNPWLWQGNEPGSYGRMIAAALILAVTAEVVCFLKRKQIWLKLAVLAAAILVPIALVWMYQYNCRLITSVIWEEDPIDMWISGLSDRSYSPTEKEQKEIMEYCRNLTVVSDEQVRQEFIERYNGEDNNLREMYTININFDRKYGHGVWFWVSISEDAVFFDRGSNTPGTITLFEDNGIAQYLENLRQERTGAAD